MKADDTFKSESIEIIESLLESISWLGGDAYEVEAVEPSIQEAQDFIDKYSDKKPDEPKFIDNTMDGIYCIKGKEETKVFAKNRHNAKNILHVGLSKISCLRVPRSY